MSSDADRLAYFETSALVKLLVTEPGSAEARAVWESVPRRICSVLAYPEARAALAAARRSDRITAAGLRLAADGLDRLIGGIARIEAREDLLHVAGGLAERHSLRGYDAVHLASALQAGPSTLIVSWDQELARAAVAAGLNAAPRLP